MMYVKSPDALHDLNASFWSVVTKVAFYFFRVTRRIKVL